MCSLERNSSYFVFGFRVPSKHEFFQGTFLQFFKMQLTYEDHFFTFTLIVLTADTDR